MAANTARVVLVDGSGFIFRAFHALPPMTSKDGTPVNAVYGFCNMLMKLREDMAGDELAVIFDTSSVTFRNDIYDRYKAHRPDPPEELIPQFALIRDAVRAFNLPCQEMQGFEADDLIATYARQAESQGREVIIVSSDKDLMQLVSDKISLFDAMKNRRLGQEAVIEKFGVAPDKVIDVQALAGDSVDNVPGVPGIGIKTAAQLIDTYGNLETLLDRAGEIRQPKRRENLIENKDLALISKKLVTLRTDVPVTLDDLAHIEPDAETLLAFFETHGFKSLISKVKTAFCVEGQDVPAVNAVTVAQTRYDLIQEDAALSDWIEAAYRSGTIAVDTETTSLDAHRAELVGVCLATEPGRACYIPVGHVPEAQNTLDLDPDAPRRKTGDTPKQLPKARVLERLKPLLEDPGILKVGQNIKYDSLILARHGIEVGPFDDTMVLSYVLDGSRHGHGLDELAKLHLDHSCIKFSDVAGKGKAQITFDKVALDIALNYAAEDADITLRLHHLLKPRLVHERLTTVYERLDRPLIGVLSKMERLGIKVDSAALKSLSDEFAGRMAVLEETCHALAGDAFNLGSPKQLGTILFDQMGIPGGKKTKTGAWQTSADVLEGLSAQGHELPTKILQWRQLSKLKSTYSDALAGHINPLTGRVHTSFAQTIVNTGRLSSLDPNLQNIPIRTEDGRKIRRAFISEPGHVLISADYSQIELRLLAHVAGLKELARAFHDGADIHAMTAAKVFGVAMAGMDPMVRRKAKAINFGIIYGISAFGLSQQLGIAQSEAKRFIDAYFEAYPGIRAYMDRAKAQAKSSGIVTTLYGRRIHIGSMSDKNPARRGFAERAAINAPIQGGASDIIKRAMIRLPGVLSDAGLSAKMLLQVHDELIFEAPEAEAEASKDLICRVMEDSAALNVPLVVEAGIGTSWAEAH